jgi:hypothetical protein
MLISDHGVECVLGLLSALQDILDNIEADIRDDDVHKLVEARDLLTRAIRYFPAG